MNNSWYRYSSYRSRYQGEPRKLAMAGCGIYSIFFGVFCLFGGLIMTVTSFVNRDDRSSPFSILQVIGPILLSIGIVMIIIGIILICCLRSMGYSSAAANLQPNQILLNGQIVTTGPAPYPNTGLQPQGQFYPPQTGYAPYPAQAVPYQVQPTQIHPSAPPQYSPAEQTYSFVPK